MPSGIGLLIVRSAFLLSWIAIGYLWKKIEWKYSQIYVVVKLAGISALQLIVLYCADGIVSYIPSWGRFPQDWIITYAASINGILFWWTISEWVGARLSGLGKKLVFLIADNTFSIMSHHLLGFFILNTLMCFLSTNTHLFDTFSRINYLSSVFYTYTPRGIPQFALVYVMFGICISLAVHFCWSCFKRCLISSLHRVDCIKA